MFLDGFELPIAHVSPITRSVQTILSNKSPQTPKSKLLNTWNLENRNLKVCSLTNGNKKNVYLAT